MNFFIQADPEVYYNKPKNNSKEYKRLSYIYKTDIDTQVNIQSLDEFKDLIKSSGSLKPWNGFMDSSSVVFIDFDKNTNAREELRRAKEYGLTPTFAYKTLSEKYFGKDKSLITKFRFVYIFTSEFTSSEEYETTTKLLRFIFDKCDKSTFNYNRWFFTGPKQDKDFIFFESTEFDKEQFILKIAPHYALSKTVKTSIKEFNKMVSMESNLEVISDINYTELNSICQLFKEFSDGKKISHSEKVLLLSNLVHIKNGDKMFKSLLQNGQNTMHKDKWINISQFMMNSKYSPMSCNFSCSHCSTCPSYKQFGSVYNTLNNKDKIDIPKIEITLEEARAFLSTNLRNDVFDMESNVVYVYKVPAGVGKTTAIINDYLNYGVVAFPNHKLLQEKKEIIEKSGRSVYSTSDVKTIVTDPDDYSDLIRFYETKNIASANSIIKKYPDGEKFLKSKNIPLTNKMITTHEKTFFANYDKGCSTIFYDEDPSYNSMFQFKKYSYATIIKDIETLDQEKLITDEEKPVLIKFLNNIREKHKSIPKQYRFKGDSVKEVLVAVSKKVLDYQRKNFLNIKTDIVSFLSAKTYSDNSYSTVKLFPQNKKIIILSATPDIILIKKIAEESGMRVIERSVPSVKRKGKIEQIIMNTSKTAYKKNFNKINSALTKDAITITYKEHSSYMNNGESVPYGGNTLGYDVLKGMELNVAYTYQCPSEVYFHKYTYINDRAIENTKMSNQYVEFNNNTFLFFTYEDKDLQQIVFHHIDSEMVQAIERSRTVSEEITTTVYSNFICSVVNFANCKFI